jgi:hypothetical protein
MWHCWGAAADVPSLKVMAVITMLYHVDRPSSGAEILQIPEHDKQ